MLNFINLIAQQSTSQSATDLLDSEPDKLPSISSPNTGDFMKSPNSRKNYGSTSASPRLNFLHILDRHNSTLNNDRISGINSMDRGSSLLSARTNHCKASSLLNGSQIDLGIAMILRSKQELRLGNPDMASQIYADGLEQLANAIKGKGSFTAKCRHFCSLQNNILTTPYILLYRYVRDKKPISTGTARDVEIDPW